MATKNPQQAPAPQPVPTKADTYESAVEVFAAAIAAAEAAGREWRLSPGGWPGSSYSFAVL